MNGIQITRARTARTPTKPEWLPLSVLTPRSAQGHQHYPPAAAVHDAMLLKFTREGRFEKQIGRMGQPLPPTSHPALTSRLLSAGLTRAEATTTPPTSIDQASRSSIR